MKSWVSLFLGVFCGKIISLCGYESFSIQWWLLVVLATCVYAVVLYLLDLYKKHTPKKNQL